ncbi:immune inhibitor A domain-containing protein [Streptomyces sp. VRA16 Mangrove soil]|uniref:immune inhibitor A domain-containing protein n=1 Tax=Streptomyces sp. VRA16 Mangrove soil TaxID=2817434 RepID=UPI001A9EF038|nr:immune inhibitor A domain-containing protein [Streptomyces sp. VRA16 Mangrove soil]MBO1337739.1 immune inhibitor A [Streptomyces sp. VRA16 Mangrove soil]
MTLAATAAAGSIAATGAQADSPAVPPSTTKGDSYKGDGHVIDGPFSRQQAEQRQTALEQVLKGDSKVQEKNGSKVVKLDKGKYVELGRERTDQIFTILVEFGDKVDSKYGGTPGPLHNQIAEPDRTKDNSTAWQSDYGKDHFQNLYFGSGKGVDSLKTYYEKTSSGRYSVDGEVSDWVKVDYNEARYGSDYCGASNCPIVEDLVRDGVNAWVADQKAAGKSDADIKADLAKYDQWDRTDHDGDGNFNEPDGYIDHFQIVHAGEDESAGGGAQGEDALWAHRGYAYSRDDGDTGPAGFKAGGTPVGDTGIWVGDYTMQPENGGLGVFAHEYGHDLGLPDLYDTTYIGENSVGFWSLMSAGSWLGTGKEAIGDMPGDMTAWDKLQLGWLNYDKAKAATNSVHKLGVSEYNTKLKQALVVELPKKHVTTDIVQPAQGATQWWSDYGDDLDNTLSRTVDLTGKTSGSLELDGWYDIEKDYDYLYTQVSTDGGASWKTIDGTADGQPIPRDGGDKPALTGTNGKYQHLVFPLDAYAGQKVEVRFRYKTDGGVAQMGFAFDNFAVKADGSTVFSDDAESEQAGWTSHGFSRVGASVSGDFPQFYIAENRQYVSYDKTLKVGPYNFGWRDGGAKQNWVEHYQYRPGLVIWQWDTSQRNNNVGQHPGQGLILPIDAHAKPLYWADGKTKISNKITPYDAAFGWYPVPGMTLHRLGVEKKIPAQLGNPVFDDHKGTYWYEENATGSVKTTDTNTRISILNQPLDGSSITVKVGPSKR